VEDAQTGYRGLFGRVMFLLLYKRLELKAFNWAKSTEETLEITPGQYQFLIQDLEVIAKEPI